MVMITLNEEQKQIVESTEQNIVVISAAASGKTRCLVARAAFLLSNGIDPQKIVLMTFTNTAAEEMSQRIGAHEGMYIGTIHGYANQLLLSYGIDTSKTIEQERFNELLTQALLNPHCRKEVEYLLVDEAQDLTELEYQFLFDVIRPEHFFVVGDQRQSIYGFRDARPDLFMSLSDREDTVTFHLNKNYRNAADILMYAKRIIDKAGLKYIDRSIPMSEEKGKVYTIENANNIIPSLITQSVNKNSKYSDWFILCRYNSDIETTLNILRKNNIPNETFKRRDMDNNDLSMALKNNTVKVMTIHAAKGLEADNVIVIGQKFFSDEERRISYVASTRARKNLFILSSPKKKNKMAKWE